MLLTGYGTEDPIEKVVEFCENLGFVGEGGPGEETGLIRWIGVRGGSRISWRKVDIATGPVHGTPEWTTAYEIMAPDCDSGAPG